MTIITEITTTRSEITVPLNMKKRKSSTVKKQKKPSANIMGQVRVTRNISAVRVETRTEPLDFPESGVLYLFHTDDWTNKMSFYDKVAYSFGIPSTQKPVHCSYLNSRVMHYERTCQGVYYCKHHHEGHGDCTVKPARYRFHACWRHKQSLQKSEHKCPVKLHFYVPIDTNDHRRLLLVLNDHNHALLQPNQVESPISSYSPESPITTASPNLVSRTPSPVVCTSASPTLLSPASPTPEVVIKKEKRSFDTMNENNSWEPTKRIKFSSLQFLNLSAITNNFKPEMLSCASENDTPRPILPSISMLGLDFM